MAGSAEFSTVANKTIKEFVFPENPFDGNVFYDMYKNADFLNEQKNVRTILSFTKELRQQYNTIEPGKSLSLKGMYIFKDEESNVPLVLKKSQRDDESDVDQNDFTLRRLLGLVAAHVDDHKAKFVNIYSVESASFGLKKPPNVTIICGCNYKEYLSAVSGAEYFVKHFDYYPFLCALRRFQQKQISEGLLLSIAKITHYQTLEPMATRCQSDFETAKSIAKNQFKFDLREVLKIVPVSIKEYLIPKL